MVDWVVKKSDKNTELFHLNRIFKDILRYVGTLGIVQSVTGSLGITVDSTDPANPDVRLDASSQASLALADTAVQPGDLATVATTGDYDDLSGTPTIPAQFNPIAGTNMSLSGTYPNITFDAATGSAGGVLPVVTGEISSGQPIFVIAEDSSLIYLPVEA